MAAKTAEGLRVLNEKIRLHQVHKFYLCLVHGTPSPLQAVIQDTLLKDSKQNQVRVVKKNTPGARTASMSYKVLQSRGKLSLVECELFTGRTHQIRVQLSHRGWPLVGDTKYGTMERNRPYGMTHQALYSYKLHFSQEGDWGELSYLKGKTFQVEDVPFLPFFYNQPKN